jgi:hypothetical protein
MKKFLACFLLSCFGLTLMLNAQTNMENKNPSGNAVLRHVVLFKFKDNADPKGVQTVIDAFKELPRKIDLIKDFEWGTNNSPENLNQGLTHCFFLTFASEKDRDAYLVHPAHKAFGNVLKPYLDKVTVVDYWVNK